MTETQTENTIFDFGTYPPIGGDDWRYAFETAQIRAIEMQMLSRAALLDIANAPDFASAIASLAAGEYALPQGGRNFADVESLLLARRAAARGLFAELMLDRPIVEVFRSRDDFANLRLALRRSLTDRPLGEDYSSEGNFPPGLFEQVFGEEAYHLLPDYMQEAVEQGVLGYYQNKDVRQIDHAIDRVQLQYNLKQARRLESIFLIGLFRIQIDLLNIRTMLRVKLTEAEQRNVFFDGGYVDSERFGHGLDVGYESLGQLFFATPYHRVVEAGAGYVASNGSFLKVEQQCDEHLTGYLKLTVQVTAGPQPIIAYLLMKEHEIRTLRLILTAKKNHLDAQLILDRIS